METTLFRWSFSNSSSSSSSQREIAMRVDDSIPLNPNPNPKPRPEKRGKAANPNPPKPKNPQRGLGVAQLERIRLRERWIQPTPPPYEAYAALARFGAPVAYAGSTTAAAALIGFGSGSVLRSAVHDQHYPLDRVRAEANPFLHELPSNQRGTTPTCLIEHCEFCYRKKRLFGDDLGFRGAADGYFPAMDPEKRGRFAGETREYEFFPNHSNSTDGDSAAGVSSLASAGDGSFLDLSLKL